MNVATAVPVRGESRIFTRPLLRIAAFVVIAAVLGSTYAGLGSMLYHQGFIADRLLFFAEKTDLALHGLAPHLINVGFIYPSLPYLLQLPFGNVILGGAVISGVLVAMAIDFVAHRPGDTFLRGLGVVYLAVSPLTLYLAVEDFAGLLFIVMAAGSVHYLLRFLRDDFSLHLFIGSTLLGLTVFVDYRSVALMAVIVPAVGLPLLLKSRAQALSVTLTILVPTLFFTLAWMYLNWVFLSDQFAFIHGSTSFLHALTPSAETLASAGDLATTLKATVLAVILSLPISLPYFAGLVSLRYGRSVFAAPAVALYIVPVLSIFFALYGGTYRASISGLALFLFVLLFSLEQLLPTMLVRATLVVSFLASFAMPFFSPDGGERAFVAALVGAAPSSNLAPVRALATRIAGGPGDHVLLDDLHLYSLVHESGDPRRFILPYQYEFESAASNPAAFARYVVLARRKDDMIAALYPDAEFSGIPGFREILRTPAVLVFERKERP
jgi:hypothetical protein